MRSSCGFLLVAALLCVLLTCQTASPQSTPAAANLSAEEVLARIRPAMALILAGGGDGKLTGMASAPVIRADGILLTAYHLIKDAREVQARLSNGEVFDKVELIACDERRDVCALRITASGLSALPVAPAEGLQPGAPVYLVSHAGGLSWMVSAGTLNAIRPAEEVASAGSGYRIVEFTVSAAPGATDGVLVDAQARALGLMVAAGQSGRSLKFAVPIESVAGLANLSGGTPLGAGSKLGVTAAAAAASTASQEERAAPIAAAVPPQPQKPLGPDMRDPDEILRNFRTIYVHSDTIYMRAEVMRRALEQRPEFSAWGLQNLEDRTAADLYIEITRPWLTFDWTYKMVYQKNALVLGAGKIVAWDDRQAAPQLAAEIAGRIKVARAVLGTSEPTSRQTVLVQRRDASPGKQWRVEYKSGTAGIMPGTTLTVNVNGERIAGLTESGVAFWIPATNVVAVGHNSQVQNPAEAWYTFWGELAGGEESPLFPFMIPIMLAGGLVLEPLKTTDHFLRVDWQENGAMKNVVLGASETDYESLLSELQTATRREWRDVPQLVWGIREELEREKSKSTPIELDRKVKVGWTELPAGLYQLVVLERKGRLAEIYFFSGREVNPNQIVAQAVVEVERRPANVGLLQVSYKEENGIFTLSEIRTPDKVLRFTPVPLGMN